MNRNKVGQAYSILSTSLERAVQQHKGRRLVFGLAVALLLLIATGFSLVGSDSVSRLAELEEGDAAVEVDFADDDLAASAEEPRKENERDNGGAIGECTSKRNWENIDWFPHRSRSRSRGCFSWHVCHQGDPKEAFNTAAFSSIDWFSVECIFYNLGLDTNGTFVYHQDPMNLPRFGFQSGNYPITAPAAAFSTQRNMRLRFVNGSIADTTYGTRAADRDSDGRSVTHILTYLSQTRFAVQPGHDYEYLWRTFVSMANLGQLSLENPLVLFFNPESPNPFNKTSKTWGLLSRNITFFEHWKGQRGGTLFPAILIGQRVLSSRPALTVLPPSLTRVFRNRVFDLLSIPIIRPEGLGPRVLIRNKDSHHRFLNQKEFVHYLKTALKGVDVLEFSPEKLSIEDEVRAVADAAVYITPGGGGSFSGIFLRDGSTAIYGNVCWPGNPKTFPTSIGTREFNKSGNTLYCYRLENHIWTAFNYYQKVYIGAETLSDLADELFGVRATTYETKLFAYSFNVSINRLAHYVEDALLNTGFEDHITTVM